MSWNKSNKNRGTLRKLCILERNQKTPDQITKLYHIHDPEYCYNIPMKVIARIILEIDHLFLKSV